MPQSNESNAKTASLREHGALNPRPHEVTDEAFRSSPFFDALDLVQVKYEMVRRVQHDGQPVTQAAKAFGFSRPSFYQAQAALARGGLPELVPRRRGPRGPHKLSDEVLDFVEQSTAISPSISLQELAFNVAKRFGVVLHPRSIKRGLVRRRQKKRSAPEA